MERLGRVRRRVDGSNACTYIPLKQRRDAYSKHGLTVRAASEDLVDLGQACRKKDLNTASFLLDSGEKGKAPSSLRQASRKALLLADGLLISANSGSLGREILVARYYIAGSLPRRALAELRIGRTRSTGRPRGPRRLGADS